MRKQPLTVKLKKGEKFAFAAEVLRRGGVGVMPTDTIYGIVGSALRPSTVRRIYRLRRRNLRKPMIILIFDQISQRKQKKRIYQRRQQRKTAFSIAEANKLASQKMISIIILQSSMFQHIPNIQSFCQKIAESFVNMRAERKLDIESPILLN